MSYIYELHYTRGNSEASRAYVFSTIDIEECLDGRVLTKDGTRLHVNQVIKTTNDTLSSQNP